MTKLHYDHPTIRRSHKKKKNQKIQMRFLSFLTTLTVIFAKNVSYEKNIENELSTLKNLYEKKLISEKEFETFRVAILEKQFRTSTTTLSSPSSDPKLVWSDEFDTLDFSKWKHEITLSGGGNWEFEYYANNRSNSFVKDGVLYLKPTLTADTMGEAAMLNGGDMDLWGGSPADACTSNAFYGCERTSNGANIINPIQSARLRTAETFSFKYGKIEVNASLPRGDWIWPAIWLLPTNQEYGIWPASGEIDIIESRGNDAEYEAGGCDTVGSTLHWGPFYPDDKYLLTHGEMKLEKGDFTEGFHVFGMEWDEDHITTYVDDVTNPILSVKFNESGLWNAGGWDKDPTLNNPWKNGGKNAPFDQDFYLILNVAVGGTNPYFPDGVGDKCWNSKSATAAKDFWSCKDKWYSSWESAGERNAMRVASVRVWQ